MVLPRCWPSLRPIPVFFWVLWLSSRQRLTFAPGGRKPPAAEMREIGGRWGALRQRRGNESTRHVGCEWNGAGNSRPTAARPAPPRKPRRSRPVLRPKIVASGRPGSFAYRASIDRSIFPPGSFGIVVSLPSAGCPSIAALASDQQDHF